MSPTDDRAWLDVRKGRFWTGARIPVDLSLRDGALVLTVASLRLDRKQRGALVRFCGDDVLSTLIAQRRAPEIVLPLAETRVRYPSLFGAGRTHIRVDAPGRPPAVLVFTAPAALGDPLANPFGFTMRVLRAGPGARAVRDRWKAALEGAAREGGHVPVR